MDENLFCLSVKWAGKEYPIKVKTEDTVSTLRCKIYKETNVLPIRQKLLNLKYQGQLASDDKVLSSLNLKHNFKLLMFGSTEKDIENASTSQSSGFVLDDLQFCATDETIVTSTIYLNKIERRIRDYKIKELNNPREGKYLLVLDIDYTLFDHRSVAENIIELMRPYMHSFLASVYPFYDIVIWSATAMRWIEKKIKMFGISTNPNYKIWFCLDSMACISITTEKKTFDTKPLGLIWGKFIQYNAKNTIIIDDIRKNFIMNPESGLKIKSFRHSVRSNGKDSELVKLSNYLINIAVHNTDFETLNHKNWTSFKP